MESVGQAPGFILLISALPNQGTLQVRARGSVPHGIPERNRVIPRNTHKNRGMEEVTGTVDRKSSISKYPVRIS